MNEMDMRIEPLAPAVVITGATAGIGRALAEEFARGGHTLLLVARNKTKLAEVARALEEAHGVEVKAVASDLCTEEGCAAVEDALRRHGFYADALVNNAAMMVAGFFQDQDVGRLRQLVDLNVRAVIDLTRRLLPGMLARGRGGVLNVSSVEAFMPVPYQATYAATKAFILAWSRALAYETMGSGVRISAVAPGAIATDMHEKAGAENSRYFQFLPVMTAEQVARAAYQGFNRGRWVILSGWLNRLVALGVRFVPGILLIPAVGWFFRVRDAHGNVQWPRPLPGMDAKETQPGKVAAEQTPPVYR
jgi:short-subunit dehydrogenase